jgi:hypothetical protein
MERYSCFDFLDVGKVERSGEIVDGVVTLIVYMGDGYNIKPCMHII